MAYSYAQLEGYWDNAGGDPNVAPVMAAIALAESSGINQIQKGQPYAKTGWGLWQITPGNSEPQFGTDQALLNPVNNAHAAVAKYNTGGLGEWTTYTSGAYKQYYQSGVTPDRSVSSNTGGTANATPAGLNIPGLGGGSSIGSSFLSGLVSGLGLPDIKDLAERAGLIIFGVVLLIIGVLRFTGTDTKIVKAGKTAAETAAIAA